VSDESGAAARLAEKCDRPARPTASRAGPLAVSTRLTSVNTGEAGQFTVMPSDEEMGRSGRFSTDCQQATPSRNR